MKPKLTLRDLCWLVLVCAVACVWWAEHRRFVNLQQKYLALAAGADDSGIDLYNDVDRRLLAFCQGALLRDRGLASNCFYSTDKWIAEALFPNERFQKALDESNAVITPSEKNASSRNDRSEEPTDIIHCYQRTDKDLWARLTPKQRERIPGVYLRAEGLMALCRPEFAELLDDEGTQERIRQVVLNAFSDEASPFHRAIFTLTTLEEVPLLAVELRRVSWRTDLQIVKLLSVSERQKVAAFLTQSSALDGVVGGPSYGDEVNRENSITSKPQPPEVCPVCSHALVVNDRVEQVKAQDVDGTPVYLWQKRATCSNCAKTYGQYIYPENWPEYLKWIELSD